MFMKYMYHVSDGVFSLMYVGALSYYTIKGETERYRRSNEGFIDCRKLNFCIPAEVPF